MSDDRFAAWLEALEQRHLADLKFSEVTRALRALSVRYVERRETLAEGAAFGTAGKRAAYALYYGPLHFLTAREILRTLDSTGTSTGTTHAAPSTTHLAPSTRHPAPGTRHLFDCGCGTGAAGAAWASALAAPPKVTAVDSHPWAVKDAALTYRTFGINADVRRGDLARVEIPRSVDGIIAGWVINELTSDVREALLPKLLSAASNGCRVLVVEPIATRVSPWWPSWADAFRAVGGRADQWRFRVPLPELIRRLDRASGMRHDELKAKSLATGFGNGVPETGVPETGVHRVPETGVRETGVHWVPKRGSETGFRSRRGSHTLLCVLRSRTP